MTLSTALVCSASDECESMLLEVWRKGRTYELRVQLEQRNR